MPALLRRPGSAGARPSRGRPCLDRACAPAEYGSSGSTDKQDQPNQSVHVFRGTSIRPADTGESVDTYGQPRVNVDLQHVSVTCPAGGGLTGEEDNHDAVPARRIRKGGEG